MPQHTLGVSNFVMKDPRSRLSKLLNEPVGKYDQDWEWVVSDSTKFRDYLRLYNIGYLTDQERNILMVMMLQCVNDIKVEFGFYPKFWLEVKFLLIRDHRLHRETIEYWSSLGGDSMQCDSWAISKELRKIYWQYVANKPSS